MRGASVEDHSKGLQEGARIAWLSVWTLLLLGAIELVFSHLSGSVALFADGIDSISDASVSFFVFVGLRFAQRPPTRKFPYGYYKIESLTALITAMVLIGVGILVFWRSYEALLNPHPISLPLAALLVLLAAGLISLYRSLQMNRIAGRYNILSLKLDAKNSVKDAVASFIAFASVFISTLGFYQMDAIGGMLISFYILAVSYVAIKESSLSLVDAFHDPELAKELEAIVRADKHIREVRELRLRRAGPFIVGRLEIVVDRDMTVGQAHEVVTGLETSIKNRIVGLRTITVKAVPFPENPRETPRTPP